jgi:dTDP-4-amino-4,6-dideoxygalactose transaminase
MPRKTNGLEGSGTRRTFLKSAGALAAGVLTHHQTTAGTVNEKLALFGGSPAVTYSDRQHAEARRWPRYGPEEEQAVLDLLRNTSYAPIGALEKDWKEYIHVPHVRAHCNGTSALAAMFFALDLPPGSEFMVPSYTFFATIVPLRLFGLVPVFVDINPRTLNFDVEDAQRRLTKNTRAVLPVHWVGLPCDMDAIGDFAAKHGLIVLEDAAHAHGASLKGKPMGAWGRMAIVSYQVTKPLPAIEGGMGMYQRQDDYERATAFGHYDLPASFPSGSAYRKYQGTGLGLKFRMHPVSAALARVQLRSLDKRNAAGVEQVRRLNDRLVQLPGLVEPRPRPDMKRIYYSSNMLFLDDARAGVSRAALVKALQAEGVRARASSYLLQHKCALYQEEKWWHHRPHIPELPGSEEANRTALALPYFTADVPELVEQYAKAFEKVWAHRKELK